MYYMAKNNIQSVTLSREAIKKGVVLLDLEQYHKLQRKAVPTYYLTGKKAKNLDRLVKEGLREHKGGKTKKINSLADLD